MKLFVAGIAALCLGGCGTITRGSSEDVTVQVSPADARVTTDIGMSCIGSCVLKVPRKQSFTVTAAAPGYQSMSVPVGTRISGGGAGGMAGNILLGGVIGGGVDLATGAMKDHYPNPVVLQLQPAGPMTPRPSGGVPVS